MTLRRLGYSDSSAGSIIRKTGTMMTAETVTLAKEKETLLITLYAKAEESRLPDSLLRDRFAAEAVRRIAYHFAKLKVRRDTMIGVAMRAKILDDWTSDFIARNPGATVLHLGCGLDSRVFRLDPPLLQSRVELTQE